MIGNTGQGSTKAANTFPYLHNYNITHPGRFFNISDQQNFAHLRPGLIRHPVPGGERHLSRVQVRRMCAGIPKETGFPEPIRARRSRTTVLTDICDVTKDIKPAGTRPRPSQKRMELMDELMSQKPANA